MQFQTTLLMSQFVTHDVKRFVLERPEGFSFTPGQGVELIIDEPRWRDEEGRPFTPTCHIDDRVLEFTIKRYPDHAGVTDRLHTLTPGAKLLISEPFGTISYKGPGTFLAAGAGITPFLAIFRQQARKGGQSRSRLLFSNKTPDDVICEKELRHYFGVNALFTCTRVSGPGYGDRRIDRDFLEEWIIDRSGYFYVCGPELFLAEVTAALQEMGIKAEALVFEE
ncbi:MAG: FAD-binding oxidoreductase [Thermodesulfobacteriota bacterium]